MAQAASPMGLVPLISLIVGSCAGLFMRCFPELPVVAMFFFMGFWYGLLLM
jgi:hypothetical protein